MPVERDAVSEIIYPEKDYDITIGEPTNRGITTSASVPNLSQQQQSGEPKKGLSFRQPRGELFV